MKAVKTVLPAIPLVGKLEIFLSRYGQTIYPSFISGGGTADHLTGSLLTNLMFLETMVGSDFFSDLSLLSYKFMAWIWSMEGVCTMWLSELGTFAMF